MWSSQACHPVLLALSQPVPTWRPTNLGISMRGPLATPCHVKPEAKCFDPFPSVGYDIICMWLLQKYEVEQSCPELRGLKITRFGQDNLTIFFFFIGKFIGYIE